MAKLDRSDYVALYKLPNRLPPRPVCEQLLPLLAGHESKARASSFDDADVAAQLGYSPRQFARICTAALGEPVGAFVRRSRLERAAGRLAMERASVSEIGEEAGYLSPEAFAKAFHKHFDCSPSTFRALNHSTDCLMPGYLISRGIKNHLPQTVNVVIGEGRTTRFIFDGPVFLARVKPDGAIDWLPR